MYSGSLLIYFFVFNDRGINAPCDSRLDKGLQTQTIIKCNINCLLKVNSKNNKLQVKSTCRLSYGKIKNAEASNEKKNSYHISDLVQANEKKAKAHI